MKLGSPAVVLNAFALRQSRNVCVVQSVRRNCITDAQSNKATPVFFRRTDTAFERNP
jgi:hypothetical protein